MISSTVLICAAIEADWIACQIGGAELMLLEVGERALSLLLPREPAEEVERVAEVGPDAEQVGSRARLVEP